MILCVAANPSIDKLFEVERLRPGQIHRPISFTQVAGGKGLNVARAARALGAEVVAVGILAGYAGQWVEQELGREDVRGSFAWADGETRDSLSVADRETQSLTEFYEAGAAVTPTHWQSFEAAVSAELSRASWMTISGSLLPGSPGDGYARLIEAAHTAGVRSAVDAHGPSLEAALAASPDLVKINRTEARALLDTNDGGYPGASGASNTAGDGWATEAAAAIKERSGGPGHAAVVTLGTEGALLARPDGSFMRGSAEAQGPYPVGSGDAFLAGLITALDDGGDWAEALALALGAAAANAETPGAGRLDADRARALADKARVRLLS